MFELEGVRSPMWSFNNRVAVGITVFKITEDVGRKKIPPEGIVDEGVGNASKGVLKVKECDMGSALPESNVFDDFFKGSVVFNTTIDAWSSR